MFGLFKKKSSSTSTTTSKRFFSVLLSQSLVQAAMWETGEIVKILAKSSVRSFSGDIDLLVKLDQCLQELGPEGETVHQTLFHLDATYVVGSEIAPDKKALFQKLTEALQLESLGFVTNTESVVNAKLEINPELTRQLVVEFVTGQVIYSLYEGKTLIETISLPASEDLVTQFKGVLVQLAGQLGVDYTVYFETDAGAAPPTQSDLLAVDFISGLFSSDELTAQVNRLPASLPLKSEILGSDILLSFILVPSATIIARSYGWLPEPEPEPSVAPTEASVPPEEPVSVEEPLPVLSRQKNFTPPAVERGEFDMSTATESPSPKGSRVGWIVFGGLLLVALAAAAVIWWLVGQGVATLTLTPKKSSLPKSLEVIVDPTAKTADYENNILPGSIETTEIVTEIEYTTTGQKNVGESARGKVEIRNKKKEEKTIRKGTVIENGVVSYTLNDEITVGAAEEDGDGIKFAKKEVDVTAVTVGAAGNIKKGTSLRVGSDVKDDIEAIAVEDFSGGTDKTVQVFSEEDQKAALALAEDELLEAARDQIGDKRGDTYLAVQIEELKIISSQFDAQVGDETKQVTLTVTGQVPVIAYQLNELGPLAKEALERDLPAGYEFIGDEPDILSAVNEKATARGDGEIHIDVDLTQGIESIIDVDNIRRQLLGQNLTKVENFLKGQEAIKTYELTWSNRLTPTLTRSLPKNEAKLVIEVVK